MQRTFTGPIAGDGGGAHAATHALGGTDPLTPTAIGAIRQLTIIASSPTVNNAPGALTEVFAGAHRVRANLAPFTQMRLGLGLVNLGSVGSAGTELRLQYSLDDGANWDYVDGVGGPKIALDVSAAFRESALVDITGAARAEVLLRPVTIGGNDIADPSVGPLHAYLF